MDLTMSVGGSQEKSQSLQGHIEKMAAKYNKPLFSFVMDPSAVPEKLSKGYRILAVVIDVYLLTQGANKTIASMEEVVKKLRQGTEAKEDAS